MDAAWELGITTFDTADAYGGGQSETIIGKWMASRGVRPQIATKTFNPMAAGQDHGLARARIGRQIESSLDRLGVDAVDLYLAHEFDPDIPVAETVADIRGPDRARLIRAYGVSNFSAEQLVAMLVSGKPARRAELLLAARPRRRGRARAAVRRARNRVHAVRTTGRRLADREVQARRARARGIADGDASRPLRASAQAGDVRCARPARRDRGTERRRLGDARDRLAARPPGVTAVVVGPRRPQHLEPALRALEHPLSAADADEVGALFAF